MTQPRADAVGERVRAFYEQAPFNRSATTAAAAERVFAHDLARTHPALDRLLRSGAVHGVLEFGCGAGWLANSIALHHELAVTGVDFCGAALEQARAVATDLATGALFAAADLFAYRTSAPADLVVCEGVLHHTHDAAAAFEAVAAHVANGGHVHVGLYHEYGRRPFLEHFRGIVRRDGEAAALRAYGELDRARNADEVQLASWFRDQVLHPHESSHTLRELCDWPAWADFSLVSTSLNGFAPIESEDDVFELEPAYEDLARHAIEVDRRYFPGFFTVLARRCS